MSAARGDDEAARERIGAQLARHRPRATWLPGKRSAVLVPLSLHPGEAPERAVQVTLIKRSEALRAHAGQYALPGGSRDPSDRDDVATALREAHEELGLEPAGVRVLGQLSEVATFAGFVIAPVVGWVAHDAPLRPDGREVALVLRVPLAVFLPPPSPRSLRFEGLRRLTQGYEHEGHVVWGATARILRELGSVVAARYQPAR